MANRRQFLRNSSSLLGGAFLVSAMDSSIINLFHKHIAPGDQVNIGAIGINGMGWSNVIAAMKVPGVNIIALCDVDKNVLDKRMGELSKKNIDITKIKTYTDYRKLL